MAPRARPTTATPIAPPKVFRNTGYRSADVHAEVAGDPGEPGAVTVAHCAEPPLVRAAVHLAEDHRGLGGRVLGEVVAGDLGSAGLVDDPDERVADLAEVLATSFGVVDRHREDDLVHLTGYAGQVDLD